MSDASIRGRSYELKIQKLTRRILHLDIKRDSRSGAGVHKADIRDRYNELPVFIECKNHEVLKPKEWFRDADAKSSFGQAPIVVFPVDTEDLCIMRYTDLLQFIKEAADWKETADDLRQPQSLPNGQIIDGQQTIASRLQKAVETKQTRQDIKVDANGHITDSYGYCMQKGCKFSRTYKPKKAKK